MAIISRSARALNNQSGGRGGDECMHISAELEAEGKHLGGGAEVQQHAEAALATRRHQLCSLAEGRDGPSSQSAAEGGSSSRASGGGHVSCGVGYAAGGAEVVGGDAALQQHAGGRLHAPCRRLLRLRWPDAGL